MALAVSGCVLSELRHELCCADVFAHFAAAARPAPLPACQAVPRMSGQRLRAAHWLAAAELWQKQRKQRNTSTATEQHTLLRREWHCRSAHTCSSGTRAARNAWEFFLDCFDEFLFSPRHGLSRHSPAAPARADMLSVAVCRCCYHFQPCQF